MLFCRIKAVKKPKHNIARKISEFKVAFGKPKRKHCTKPISQEQEEKENAKKSRPFKQNNGV